MAENVVHHIGEVKIIEATVSGPSSYSQSSNFSVTFNKAKKILCVLAISNDGGYMAESGEATISDNTVTFPIRYFDYDATADGAAIEVADTTNLSGVTFKIVVLAV